MERKNFLKTLAIGTISSSVLLAACGGSTNSNQTTAPAPEPTPNPEPAPEPAPVASADCNDVSGLTEADITQRNALGYVAKSEDAEKNCGNCRFYQPGTQANGCGGCQLFKGPVSPEGNCKSWFKKDA